MYYGSISYSKHYFWVCECDIWWNDSLICIEQHMRITMNYTKLKLIQLEQTVTKFKNQCFNQIYLHCFECSSQSRPIRTHTLDDWLSGPNATSCPHRLVSVANLRLRLNSCTLGKSTRLGSLTLLYDFRAFANFTWMADRLSDQA